MGVRGFGGGGRGGGVELTVLAGLGGFVKLIRLIGVTAGRIVSLQLIRALKGL